MILLLEETVQGLLKAQRFQAAQSWTRHTLTQHANVLTEVGAYFQAFDVIYGPQTHKELAKKATADPEWARVICQPLLSQVNRLIQ